MLTAITALFLVSVPALAAPPDWRATVSAPQVMVKDGHMNWQSIALCRSSVTGKSFQVHSTATAPVDAGISSDFFLSFASGTEGLLMGGLLGAVAGVTNDANVFKTVKCRDIGAVIGKADLTITLTMAEEGWQMEWSADGKSERSTASWADTFAE